MTFEELQREATETYPVNFTINDTGGPVQYDKAVEKILLQRIAFMAGRSKSLKEQEEQRSQSRSLIMHTSNLIDECISYMDGISPEDVKPHNWIALRNTLDGLPSPPLTEK